MCAATNDVGLKGVLECCVVEHSVTLLGYPVHFAFVGDQKFYWDDRELGATADPDAVIRYSPTFG